MGGRVDAPVGVPCPVRGLRLAAIVAAAALLAAAVGVAGAAPAGAEPQSPEPKAWILVDAGTGEVLAARNEHEPLRPASTTKVMTALTAVERLDPAKPVPVSELAASQPPSALGISPGEQWPLETALAAILMVSANDMAYALAEAVGGGDLAQWEAIAAATAERLGMVDSTFHDPAGFDAAGEAHNGGSYMSAYDIAIATRNAIAVPALAAMGASREYEYTWPGTGNAGVLVNHNKLLPGGARPYDGATGFKTGFTSAAGHTFVGTAERGGRTLIVVILDTYDFYGWAMQLLDAGFATEPGQGTAVTLPEIAVQPYAERQAALLGFTAVALGAAEPESDATTSTQRSTGIVAAPGDTEVAATLEAGAEDGAAEGGDGAADALAAEDPEGEATPTRSGGGTSGTTIAFAVLALLTVAFFARRRQITVRKRRRAARRRAMQLAVRRGTLAVAGTRPFVGGRASSPSESYIADSHVRVVPAAPPATGRAGGTPARQARPARPARPRGSAAAADRRDHTASLPRPRPRPR
jgi:D-alanyl-D-alanine carboxypeptidase